jgi:hypothetical protein
VTPSGNYATNAFCRRVEGKITPEEYVRNLGERVQQAREASRPTSPVPSTRAAFQPSELVHDVPKLTAG